MCPLAVKVWARVLLGPLLHPKASIRGWERVKKGWVSGQQQLCPMRPCCDNAIARCRGARLWGQEASWWFGLFWQKFSCEWCLVKSMALCNQMRSSKLCWMSCERHALKAQSYTVLWVLSVKSPLRERSSICTAWGHGDNFWSGVTQSSWLALWGPPFTMILVRFHPQQFKITLDTPPYAFILNSVRLAQTPAIFQSHVTLHTGSTGRPHD